jgi:hypothetical protein
MYQTSVRDMADAESFFVLRMAERTRGPFRWSVYLMTANSWLMNHLGLVALLNFQRPVDKFFDFVRCLCFRVDLTNSKPHLAAILGLKPSPHEAASTYRAERVDQFDKYL